MVSMTVCASKKKKTTYKMLLRCLFHSLAAVSEQTTNPMAFLMFAILLLEKLSEKGRKEIAKILLHNKYNLQFSQLSDVGP